MNALAPIASKLDPLIRRLASGSDGEVVACVKAIARQLERAGLSFHDLADRLTNDQQNTAQRRERPIFSDTWEAAEWVLSNDDGRLTPNQTDFLRNVLVIVEDTWPSERHLKRLGALVRECGGRWHEA